MWPAGVFRALERSAGRRLADAVTRLAEALEQAEPGGRCPSAYVLRVLGLANQAALRKRIDRYRELLRPLGFESELPNDRGWLVVGERLRAWIEVELEDAWEVLSGSRARRRISSRGRRRRAREHAEQLELWTTT